MIRDQRTFWTTVSAAALAFCVVGASGSGSWKETFLHKFSGSQDGATPRAGLVSTAPGVYYGVTSGGFGSGPTGTVYRIDETSSGYSERVIHSFVFGTNDGAYPYAALIADSAGSLYSTTISGGTDSLNFGTVYRIAKADRTPTESVLYSFRGGKDGADPSAALLLGPDGSLYGTTTEGGASGGGTVFELRPHGSTHSERVLYAFKGGSDGTFPISRLAFGTDGALYGTTLGGGTATELCQQGCGTIFRLQRSSNKMQETVIYRFLGGSDGALPYSGLTMDRSGNFIGTTYAGGVPTCRYGSGPCGFGTVYQIHERGSAYSERILYRFLGDKDAASPQADVMIGPDGAIYGTTLMGGDHMFCNFGCGTVFALLPTGHKFTENVLHRFRWNADGAVPFGAVISDSSGNLYGTTGYGGQSCGPEGCGTVFKLSPRAAGTQPFAANSTL